MIQVQRAVSLNFGHHFLKPKVLIEAELDKGDDPNTVFEELQKNAEIMWMKECLASISEIGEAVDVDNVSDYAEKLIERIDKLEAEK